MRSRAFFAARIIGLFKRASEIGGGWRGIIGPVLGFIGRFDYFL